MMMKIPDRAWKWIAILSLGWFAIYVYVLPSMRAGISALNYINTCIEAKVCPSPQQLAAAIQAQAPKTPAPSPTPTPSPKGP